MSRCRCLVVLVLVVGLATACTGSGDDHDDTTGGAPADTGARLPALAATDIEFRPVLSSAPCSTGGPRATDDGSASTTTLRVSIPASSPPARSDGAVPDAEGILCYRLGPAIGDGRDVSQAHVGHQSATYRVDIDIRPGAVDRFGQAFTDCYQGTSACPAFGNANGAVAVTVHDTVITAPVISESIPGTAFSISGPFSRADVQTLAAALR